MTLKDHKTRSVFEHYNIIRQGDLFEAARKLDEAAWKSEQKDSGGAIDDSCTECYNGGHSRRSS